MPHELPTVTRPSGFSKTGFNFASAAGVWSSRIESSCSSAAAPSFAPERQDGQDLAREAADLARALRAFVARQREAVGVLAREIELAREQLGRLAHDQPGDRVGQALEQRDARREHRRAEVREGREARAGAARARELGEDRASPSR